MCVCMYVCMCVCIYIYIYIYMYMYLSLSRRLFFHRFAVAADRHTVSNALGLFRPAKLSGTWPNQCWGGGPPGKPFGCCRLLSSRGYMLSAYALLIRSACLCWCLFRFTSHTSASLCLSWILHGRPPVLAPFLFPVHLVFFSVCSPLQRACPSASKQHCWP